MKIKENDYLERPTDPVGSQGTQFNDWYLDSSFSSVVSFPLKITRDTTIYARFLSHKGFLLSSRDELLGDDCLGFDYDYSLNVSAYINALNKTLKGVTTGNSKYSKSTEVKYYDNHKNSDLLFYDGTVHQFVKDSTKSTIKYDENNKLTSFDSEVVSSSYKYESSSFAKVLFTYKDSDIKDVKKEGNKYVIKTKANPTSVASLIFSNLDNPVVEKVIGKDLPTTDSECSFFVTYNGNKISTYEYNFDLKTNYFTLTISYTINFKKINETVNITLPSFNDFEIDPSKVNTKLNDIKSAISGYKALKYSYDNFSLKTAVDFDGEFAINATVAGDSKRKVDNGNVYFNNKIEVDSDLKNGDLYKSDNLADITYNRGKISNGKVYDVKDKIFGYDSLEVNNYSSRKKYDDFFLLLDESSFTNNNFNSVKTKTTSSFIEYSLTLTKSGLVSLLNYFNDSAILNPFVSTNAKVFGNFAKESLLTNSIDFVVKLNKSDKSLAAFDVSIKGKGDFSFPGSRDFSMTNPAKFSAKFSFEVTSSKKDYVVPDTDGGLR